jgi:hypothetical protein
LRYSIVQGPRQSVYNAYSGACRIFCLSYLQGTAPTLYEDGAAIRDYVNIDDVVDANVLVLSDDRAAGRVFNVGGGQAVTTREFADVVRRQYGSGEPGVVTGEYRFGDTRHIFSDISALRSLGWEPRRTPADSVAGLRRLAGRAWKASTGCWPGRTRGCASSGSSGGREHEGVPAGRRGGQPAEADHRHAPRSACCPSAAGRCWTSGWTRSAGPASARSWSTSITCPRWCLAIWPRGPGRLSVRMVFEPAARQRRHARREPRLGGRRRTSSWPATPTT